MREGAQPGDPEADAGAREEEAVVDDAASAPAVDLLELARRPTLRERLALRVRRGIDTARMHPWLAGAALVPLLLVGWWAAAPGLHVPTPRDVVVRTWDRIGLRLVEGHVDRIHRSAAESGVSPTLLAAIMYAESRGRGGQTSSKGAVGLMQLAEASANDAAKRLGLEPPPLDEVRDDDDLNVRLGAAHLAWLLDNRGDWTLEQVLVSYNAGRAKLFRWMDRHGGWDGWVAHEERLAAAGEPNTGALEYARLVLDVREKLRDRGVIREEGDLDRPLVGRE